MMSVQGVPSKMKALVKSSQGRSFLYTEMDVPEPKGDEVLVKVDAASICGSDLNLYLWNNLATAVMRNLPFVTGHECTGIVVKQGPDATVAIGTRIAVENHYFCGNCYQCCYDDRSICQNQKQFGLGRGVPHGGCAQYTVVPSKNCFQLQTNISASEAVLLEPLGVAHNGMERLEVTGEDVLVTGCGPIGLMAIGCAKAMGAKRVYGADINPIRLELAKKMGVDMIINTRDEDLRQTIMSITSGDGIGRICECSGAPVVVNSIFTMLRKGGNIVMVGLPKEPLHVENVLQNVVFKSLQLRTVHGRRIFHSWEECERLVAEGKIPLQHCISHELPMSKFEEAFEILLSGNACKIILDPQK